jgi:hypothetical protein
MGARTDTDFPNSILDQVSGGRSLLCFMSGNPSFVCGDCRGRFCGKPEASIVDCLAVFSYISMLIDAGVAQLVEQLIRNQQVDGSNPPASSRKSRA